MSDAVRGSIIVVVGYLFCVIVCIFRRKKKGPLRIIDYLFIVYMIALAAYVVYKFMH